MFTWQQRKTVSQMKLKIPRVASQGGNSVIFAAFSLGVWDYRWAGPPLTNPHGEAHEWSAGF